MSNVYQALKKAERDRQQKESLSPITKMEEIAIEMQEMASEPKDQEKAIIDERIITLSRADALGAEQFRKLRTYILRHNFPETRRTILVTSAVANEGKSFVAANLAAGIAQDFQARSLLVECDLRRPTLSKWFGLQNGKGLSDYLKGDGKIFEFLKETMVEKMEILPAGSIQSNPAELLGSNKMKALLSELKGRYDDRFIIIDSTPLLATAEPEIISKLVDGVIFVIKAGVTPRETVKRAVKLIEPEKIVGVILNHITFKSKGVFGRYYGADRYYSGYGYGRENIEPKGRLKKLFRLR